MIENTEPLTGPTMKRGKSKQDVQTPLEFMEAVYKRFGSICWDLAASPENTQHASNYFTKEQNSLVQPWHKIQQGVNHWGWLWLNCEYDDIAPWASKCATEMELGARILLLTPASVGSNWFKNFVRPSAHVIFLNGRIQFVGHKTGYPKDLALSVYCSNLTGDSIWRWK